MFFINALKNDATSEKVNKIFKEFIDEQILFEITPLVLFIFPK